jgi:hypothetical protein
MLISSFKEKREMRGGEKERGGKIKKRYEVTIKI